MPFFILYIYTILLCGTIYIGPVSFRVAVTCCMTVYLIYYYVTRKGYIKIDRSYIWIYILFSCVMGLSLLVTGEFDEYDYIKKFLAHNFVAIIAFLAIEVSINSYRNLKILLFSLLLLILVNDIVTILQYCKNPISWAIGYIFGDIDKFVGRIEGKVSLLGISATPGIFGDVVKNAYYITILTPLSFCLINKQSKKSTNIFAITVFIASLVAIFMTQQRAAFYIIILCVCVYFLVVLKKHTVLIIFISFILSTIYILGWNDQVSTYDLGRLSVASDNQRHMLIKHALDFIGDHPLFGDPVKFLKLNGLSAHNIILDSYINAGFLGFIIMTLLFFKASFKSIVKIYHGFKIKENYLIILFSAYALLSSMIYGLSHNTSFLTGEVGSFIILAIVLKIETLEKSSSRQRDNNVSPSKTKVIGNR